jgi:thiamine-monophosphate kinase
MTRRDAAGPLMERPFHRWLARRLAAGPRGLLPVGDDVAALPLRGRAVVLLTTDALSEGTHFRRGSDPRAIGRAVAAVSLSDLAAKGGTPVAGLLDLLVPSGTPRRWAEAVVEGADEMGRRFGAPLVGGDTKPAAGRVVVGTFLGRGRADRLAPRSGARPGDVVAVTGQVGAGGWQARQLAARPASRAALAGLLGVAPRVAEGRRLVRWARAMTDTSDGVAEAARLVAAASGCRIVVEEAQLPWDPALAREIPAGPRRRSVAFYGGDYELFLTVPPSAVPPARRALASLGCPLTVVGSVRPGRGATLRGVDGRLVPMPPSGWDPFAPALP